MRMSRQSFFKVSSTSSGVRGFEDSFSCDKILWWLAQAWRHRPEVDFVGRRREKLHDHVFVDCLVAGQRHALAMDPTRRDARWSHIQVNPFFFLEDKYNVYLASFFNITAGADLVNCSRDHKKLLV